jgi:flagellar motility protein MotE (MotC chaperone)
MHIQDRLLKAAQKVREQETLLHRREATCNLIKQQKEHWQQLKKQLDRELKDVEQLEGFTLQNFWHSIRGTKDVARHKEQEEYLAAKMKFDSANAALENLQNDLRRIDNALAALGDVQTEYQWALREKERYLWSVDKPESRRLMEIAERLGYLQAQAKEVAEAIDAGQKTSQGLTGVEKSLSSAQGWGVVDIIGGGLIITAIKHSHIGSARRYISQAQQQLRRFQTELADVKKTNTSLEIGNIWTLADFLLDGLLFDFIVQSQINAAQHRTRQLKQEITATIQDLYQLQRQNQQETEKLNEERQRLIEAASI